MRQDLQLNVKAEDSPQNAHRAVDVATRTAQDQTQQLHDVHLKAKTTRERIAAPALETRKKEEKDKGGGGERSRIQQEREHFNTPNKSALKTSKDPFPFPPPMTCCPFAMIHMMRHFYMLSLLCYLLMLLLHTKLISYL